RVEPSAYRWRRRPDGISARGVSAIRARLWRWLDRTSRLRRRGSSASRGAIRGCRWRSGIEAAKRTWRRSGARPGGGESRRDPRRSVEERYRSREEYLAKIRASADALIKGRYLLQEDVENVLARANAHWEYAPRNAPSSSARGR